MGPSLTLRARELNMHGAAAFLFSAGEKCPGSTPATRLSTCTCFNALAGRRSSSQHGADPIFSPLRSTIGRRRRPLKALSTSVTADEPWPSAQPAQPARWRSRMLDRGKTYPSPAAPPTPHEYLCVTLPLYLPFLSRPCVETCTNGYQPGNHPWPQPGISLETLWGSTLSIALAASSPCLSGTKCFKMAVASQH